jgi:CheY-like chemotaxis protein
MDRARRPVYNSSWSLGMPTANVLIVDDRLRSAQQLVAWLSPTGAKLAVAATWAEASDTLAYQQLAGTTLPDLLLGPLAKDGVDVLAALRGQGITPRTAFYTESKSRDQDPALMRQYALTAILHKPFADEDARRLFAARDEDNLAGSSHLERGEVELPSAPPPPASFDQAPQRPGAQRDAFDDLIGSSRGSSVKLGSAPPPTKLLKAEELPSGVQRLLVDPMAEQPKQARAANGEVPLPGDPPSADGPRPIAMMAVEDKNGSARQIVERLGMPGQTCKAVASYQDAIGWLERLNKGTGCELLFGPLSAEGVAAVREFRKRSWPTHVVFYTESSSQSQDPRLLAQYGALAIVRRAGMAEQLEKIVADLRAKPRQAPVAPDPNAARAAGGRGLDPARTSGLHTVPTDQAVPATAVRTSGLHAVPQAEPARPAAGPPPATNAPAARPGLPASRISGIHAAPPTGSEGTARHAQPAAAADPNATRSGISRLRRSIGAPGGTPGASPPADGSSAPPLEIDVPEPATGAVRTRVISCQRCKQEFVATAGGKAECPHCGTANPTR